MTSVKCTWLLAVVLVIVALGGCQQRSGVPEDVAGGMPLLVDADFDAAVVALPGERLVLEGAELEELRGWQEARERPLDDPAGVVSPRATLPDAVGTVAFVRHNPDLSANPWMVYLMDQAADVTSMVYGGRREIDSVAVSADANVLLLAMRRTIDASGDFEVYRVTLDADENVVERLTVTPYDERNVSMSSDASVLAWEGEDGDGKRAVFVREGDTEAHLALALEQSQPSVSADGNTIALVRILANGNPRVVRYEREGNSYQVLWGQTAPVTLSHPSVSADGGKVAFLEYRPEGTAPSERQLVRYLDTVAETVTNAVGVQLTDGPRIAHPHLAADGDHLAYAWRQGDAWNIFTRRVSTLETQRIAVSMPPTTNHAPYWQQAGPPAAPEVYFGETDADGIVTFDTVGLSAQILDVTTEEPLPFVQVTLFHSESGSNLVVADPASAYLPAVLSITDDVATARAATSGVQPLVLTRVHLAARDSVNYLKNQAVRGWNAYVEFLPTVRDFIYVGEQDCITPTPSFDEVIGILQAKVAWLAIDEAVGDIVVFALERKTGLSLPPVVDGAMTVLTVNDVVNLGVNTALINHYLAQGYTATDAFLFCEVSQTLFPPIFGVLNVVSYLIQPVGSPGGVPVPRSATFSVLVDDEATKAGLSAHVDLTGATPRTGVADSHGTITFRDLAPGSYAITVRHPGHQPVEHPIELAVGAHEHLRVSLQRSATSAPGTFELHPGRPHCDGGQAGVRVTWTSAAEANAYALNRNGAPYYSTIAGTAFNNSANVQAGQTYTYQVTARNRQGTTTSSNSISVTVPAGICSDPPPEAEAPLITAVLPEPVPGSNERQWLSIIGNDFQPGASVTLTTSNGTYPIPPNRTSYVSPERIDIFVNVTTVPASWTARITNPDEQASQPFGFQVGPAFEPAPSYISIENVSLGGASGGTRPVNFDISWDESWRGPDRPSWVEASDNWDAAWVFVKYRVSGGAWQHATLAASGHVQPSGSVVSVPSDRVGAFIYRSSSGYGTFAANGVGLQWDYVADGVAAGASVDVQPFGIEMVYVPQGSFSVGSGGSSTGEFRAGGTSNSPFVVSSQSSIALGDGSGQLMWTESTLTGSPSGSTSASFPTGYGAFYVMKYQVTQGQYVDFLNTLTQAQADARKHTEDRHRYSITGDSVGSYASSLPFVTLPYVSWADGAAFADWAGLRPMTELEFEKVARGPLGPVANEYAWGSTSITRARGLVNVGTSTETPTPADANANYFRPGSNINGPVRAGSFAAPGRTRRDAGAGYYGALELSGNLWERPVTVGNAEGRAFTDAHGDGTLDGGGEADVASWPNASAVGVGLRGGGFAQHGTMEPQLRLSIREIAAHSNWLRFSTGGWRGARSAP